MHFCNDNNRKEMILENRTIQKFLNACYAKLFKIELIILIIIVIGIITQKIKPEISELVLSFVLVILAVLYYFLAFRSFENKNKWDDFYLKIKYFALSVTSIGILFTLNRWAGSEIVIDASLISLALALLAGSLEITFLRKGNSFHRQDILRLVVALSIVIVFFFWFCTDISDSKNEDFRKESKQPYTQEALDRLFIKN